MLDDKKLFAIMFDDKLIMAGWSFDKRGQFHKHYALPFEGPVYAVVSTTP